MGDDHADNDLVLNKELKDFLASLKDKTFTIRDDEFIPPEWWEDKSGWFAHKPKFQPIDWAEAAICKGMDTNFFYPPRSAPPSAGDAIRAVCNECPVSVECLQYALDMKDSFGWYGGCSVDQRRVLSGGRQYGKQPTHFRDVPEMVKLAFNLGEWGPNDEA